MRMTLRQSMLVFSAVVTALACGNSAWGDTMTPVAVNGFNVDLIVEASATTLGAVNSSIDYSSTTPRRGSSIRPTMSKGFFPHIRPTASPPA